MAAKRTVRAHPALSSPAADARQRGDHADDATASRSKPRARTSAQTGVEMEALTAVAVAALTLYDMVKAVDKGMVIGDICLLEKRGGKSGEYLRRPKQRSSVPQGAHR